MGFRDEKTDGDERYDPELMADIDQAREAMKRVVQRRVKPGLSSFNLREAVQNLFLVDIEDTLVNLGMYVLMGNPKFEGGRDIQRQLQRSRFYTDLLPKLTGRAETGEGDERTKDMSAEQVAKLLEEKRSRLQALIGEEARAVEMVSQLGKVNEQAQ